MSGRLRRVSWWLNRRRREAELREELAFHVSEDVDERVAAGARQGEARRIARRDFGNVSLLVEDTRAMWIRPSLERVVQDVRYALRRMRQAPVFTAVAILSLALGIGANAAVFSLFNEVLLRPLPVPDPNALVNLASPGPKNGGVSCNQAGHCEAVFSYPMFRDLASAQTAFTGIAAHDLFRANLAYGGQTINGMASFVSGSYFSVLGLAPELGRLIGPIDDSETGGTAVAVLSYGYWTDRFGAAKDVVGKTMAVNGQFLTIVGVGPKDFSGTTFSAPVNVFVPITMRGRIEPPFNSFADRRTYWVYLFGRLRPGMSIEAARASLNGQYRTIITTVDTPLQQGLSASELAEFKARSLTLEPGANGQSIFHKTAETPLAMLFAVTGIVLAIGCANLANLLLARLAARASELAVRASIGASRRRLIGQLLIESCTLATAGGALGVVLAWWTMRALSQFLVARGLPKVDVHLDGRVLAFSFALSVLTGLVFGVFPALHSTQIRLAAALKSHAAQSSGARTAARFRATMILAQMALSTILLVTAGLFIRSLSNVSRVDLGIHTDHLITFTISPRLNGYSPEAARDLFERTEAALAAAPGVSLAAASTVPLIADDTWATNAAVEGSAKTAGIPKSADYAKVGAGFFHTVGISILAGREFTTTDAAGAPKVAIVNETFAKTFAPGVDVLGRWMRTGSDTAPFDTEIVGVARDAKYSDIKAEPPAVFYTPYRQDDRLGEATFYVRTPLAPETLLKTIPTVMAGLDPNLPVQNLRTMADQVRDSEAGDRAITTLATSFALLATLLAAIGLYGVLAYTVSQRTREFGVRIALGAAPGRVRGLVLRSVLWMTVAGGITGAGIALIVGHYLQSLLYQMKGDDPWVVAAAVATLTTVALAAAFVPAWRASRIDPMRALRSE